MDIKIADSAQDLEKCREALLGLRPHLSGEGLVSLLVEMIAEGYLLAFIEKEEKAVAVIGFRYLRLLYTGKQYYIDDLYTLPSHRGRGYAGVLIDFVFDRAREKGIGVVTLDSGYQRNEAHRLYLNKGFTLNCHHFLKKL